MELIKKELSFVNIDNTGGSPSPEDLELINSFTRSNKTADQLYTFSTKVCNTMVDRTLDQFEPDIIHDIVDLPQRGAIGKSMMISHDAYKLPKGRVYKGETLREFGVDYARLHAYMPKEAEYEELIRGIDYGIIWATSVGVSVKNAKCSICGMPFVMGWFGDYCSSEKHTKGAFYEVEDPVTKQKDLKQCFCKLSGLHEFYEFSLVYLGAQYGAEVDKLALVNKNYTMVPVDITRIPILSKNKEVKSMEKEDKDVETEPVNTATFQAVEKEVYDKMVTDVEEYKTLYANVSTELEGLVEEKKSLELIVTEKDVTITALTVEVEALKGFKQEAEILKDCKEIADEYMKFLKKESIRYFKLAMSVNKHPVDDDSVTLKLITDASSFELAKGLYEEYKALAESNFPGVRRSSTPDDLSESVIPEKKEKKIDNSNVNKLHGSN